MHECGIPLGSYKGRFKREEEKGNKRQSGGVGLVQNCLSGNKI